jgi:hypothetical protein
MAVSNSPPPSTNATHQVQQFDPQQIPQRSMSGPSTTTAHPPSAGSEDRPFACTKCPQRFRQGWEWKRHEWKVDHAGSRPWHCQADTNEPAVEVEDKDEDKDEDCKCVMCGMADSPNHRFTHRNTSDEPCRSFHRQDLLKEHLKDCHNYKPAKDNSELERRQKELLESWYQEEDDIPDDKKWCGFCKRVFPTLWERMEDIFQHYQNGYTWEQ